MSFYTVLFFVLGGLAGVVLSSVVETTKKLTRDTGLGSEDRGEHHLRGLEGSRHLYVVRGV